MAISDILDKIKEETEVKLKDINEQYEAKLGALQSDFKDKKEKVKKEMDEQVTVNSKKILNKMETLAKMEAKNKLLKEKRELLDSVFEKALDQLADSDNYKDIVVSLLKHSKIEGEKIMVVPAKGREDVTKSALSASGKNYHMAEKSTSIKGGFILESDKIEIDNSFESILHKQLRDDLELDIAKMLFPV